MMTPTDVAITIVLLASPVAYTGDRHSGLADDIVEPEVVEEVVEEIVIQEMERAFYVQFHGDIWKRKLI